MENKKMLTLRTDYFQADVTQINDYFPFGSLLPGRNFNANQYRFGFNRMEKDDEVFGSTGTSYTATFWQYDSRLGRRWNVDPVDKPWESSYATFGGNPIFYIDPNGNDWFGNENTGNVTYKEGATKYGKTGDGWISMGGDDLFGEFVKVMRDDNYDIIRNEDGKALKANFMQLGSNSKEFMREQGQKLVTKSEQLVIKKTSYLYTDACGGERTVASSERILKRGDKKVTYVSEDAKLSRNSDKHISSYPSSFSIGIRSETNQVKRTYHYDGSQNVDVNKAIKIGQVIDDIISEINFKKIKIVFPVLALCLVIGCSNINDSNVSSQDDTLQNYSSVLNFFPKKMVSHFPDVEGPNFIMYTDCVSPEGGALHIELEESLSGNNYEDIKSSYLERYTPIDSCLLIIDRFKSKDNFFDVQLSEEDKELIDLECYSSRFPIPNFWKYDYSTDKTSCKLPDDFEIYVIDASVGKFMPNELLTDGSFMPKKWKHGFSKGIAISKKRERIIYWFYVW